MTVLTKFTLEVGGAINLMRNRLKMKRVNTSPISASVMDFQTFRYGTNESHVRKSVCLMAERSRKFSVSIVMKRASPFPTECIRVSGNIFRESWKRIGWFSGFSERITPSRKQMFRVYAKRVLTTVYYRHSFCWNTMVDQPGNPMNIIGGPVEFYDLSVSKNCFSTLPEPASVRFLALFNLRPKPCENRRGESLRNEEGERSVCLFGIHAILSRALGWSNIAGVFSFCGFSTLTPTSV